MEFQNNSALFTTSATLFAKQIKLKRLQSGLPVYDGGLGENPLPVPELLCAAVKDHSHLKQYTDVQGIPEFIDVARKFYFPEADSKSLRIVVGNGLKPLLYLVQLAFTKLYSRETVSANQRALLFTSKREDFVIVHLLPAWTSYIEQINIIHGINLSTLSISGTHGDGKIPGNPNYLAVEPDYSSQEKGSLTLTWCKVTASQFEKQLLQHFKTHNFEVPSTRILVLLNSPNNPSGCVYNCKELKEFAAVFRKYKIICFADDIYAGIVHAPFYKDPSVFGGSIAKFYPEGTIQGSSLSKNWGCGGYRLGWLIFPLPRNETSSETDQIVEKTLDSIYSMCNCLASSLYSCPSVLLQHVAAEALKLSGSFLVPCAETKDHLNMELTKRPNGMIQQLKFQREMFANLAQLCKEKFDELGILSSDSKAAWYFLLDFEPNYGSKLLKRGIETSKGLCDTLVTEIGFITVSCESFGIMPWKKNFLLRYSYVDVKSINIWSSFPRNEPQKGYDASNMIAGLAALSDWLSRL